LSRTSRCVRRPPFSSVQRLVFLAPRPQHLASSMRHPAHPGVGPPMYFSSVANPSRRYSVFRPRVSGGLAPESRLEPTMPAFECGMVVGPVSGPKNSRSRQPRRAAARVQASRYLPSKTRQAPRPGFDGVSMHRLPTPSAFFIDRKGLPPTAPPRFLGYCPSSGTAQPW